MPRLPKLSVSQDFLEKWRRHVTKKSKPKVYGITDLPQEILLKIFSWVEPNVLNFTVALVCKSWRDLSRDSSLWKELSFTGHALSTNIVCSLLRLSPWLEKLELIERIDAFIILEQASLTNNQLQVLKIIACKGPDLRDTPSVHLISCVRKFPLITDLTIEFTRCCNLEFFKTIHEILPNLRKINFSYIGQFDSAAFNSIASNCAPLEELTTFQLPSFLPHCYDINTLCSRMANTLRVLKVDASGFTDESMDAIVSCQMLESLCLQYALNLTSVGILKLAELQNITSLHVSFVRRVRRQPWCDLFMQNCWGKLKDLGLEYCFPVDDKVLNHISRECYNLKTLCLSGCIRITCEGLSFVIRKCKKLKNLSVLTSQIYIERNYTLIPDYTLSYDSKSFHPIMYEKKFPILNKLRKRLPHLNLYLIDESKKKSCWRNILTR